MKFSAGKKKNHAALERWRPKGLELVVNERNGFYLSRTPPLVGSCPC